MQDPTSNDDHDDGSSTVDSAEAMGGDPGETVMWFGKHEGSRLRDLDEGYCWALVEYSYQHPHSLNWRRSLQDILRRHSACKYVACRRRSTRPQSSSRRTRIVLNPVGKRLGRQDDGIASDNDESYDSDDGFVVKTDEENEEDDDCTIDNSLSDETEDDLELDNDHKPEPEESGLGNGPVREDRGVAVRSVRFPDNWPDSDSSDASLPPLKALFNSPAKKNTPLRGSGALEGKDAGGGSYENAIRVDSDSDDHPLFSSPLKNVTGARPRARTWTTNRSPNAAVETSRQSRYYIIQSGSDENPDDEREESRTPLRKRPKRDGNILWHEHHSLEVDSDDMPLQRTGRRVSEVAGSSAAKRRSPSDSGDKPVKFRLGGGRRASMKTGKNGRVSIDSDDEVVLPRKRRSTHGGTVGSR
ncbi:uncharacterized protein JN550_005598 [Neoarthrinium moseri]|uniref:uncharacterized protein n=1 Tax=Neoarthrinium moseri TaxID=1658444 RepID=UPI001FDDF638|nr:uncharacterized protein JN550_005598 [Neoarthrinium moseri]KAI1870008.1 hypothetical protein JN550_005598 [Neoarthrinium moseri]